MILMDTHIFIWWVNNDPKLNPIYRKLLENEKEPVISVFTLWEIAKLNQIGKFQFNMPLENWFVKVLKFHKINQIPLDIKIIVESSSLPGNFHKDPADQLIVATSRILDIELMTMDEKILNYPHVKLVKV